MVLVESKSVAARRNFSFLAKMTDKPMIAKNSVDDMPILARQIKMCFLPLAKDLEERSCHGQNVVQVHPSRHS